MERFFSHNFGTKKRLPAFKEKLVRLKHACDTFIAFIKNKSRERSCLFHIFYIRHSSCKLAAG